MHGFRELYDLQLWRLCEIREAVTVETVGINGKVGNFEERGWCGSGHGGGGGGIE